MDIKNKKVSLVLSSGAARGLAHVGVIKALEEAGAEICRVTGSSIGALIGACYARQSDIKKLEELLLDMDWKKQLELLDLNLAYILKGIVRGDKVKDFLKPLLGDTDFKDLEVPLSVVATDLEKGESVVLKRGNVLDAVRASISIPAIFTPVRHEGRLLVDGGIVNPLPVKEARDGRFDIVLACNVIQPPSERKIVSEWTEKSVISASFLEAWQEDLNNVLEKHKTLPENAKKALKTARRSVSAVSGFFGQDIASAPNIFEVIMQAFYSMEHEVMRRGQELADITITPRTGDIASLEFFRAEEAIREGYQEAKRTLAEI